MLDTANWQQQTNRNRFAAVNDTGLVNAQIAVLNGLIPQYDREKRNWEPARATAVLNQIVAAAMVWLAANNAVPTRWHPLRRRRYQAAQGMIQTLLNEANAHLTFWGSAANAKPPTGMGRQYRDPAVSGWTDEHPFAGQGTERYASILEIVTPPYPIETAAGRADLVAAMTEADQLAAGIELATNNFAQRARLDTVPNTNIANPLTHVGNNNNNDPTKMHPQSTDASIQSTFAIDLTQIPALMSSTVAFMAPQQQFDLKHQADQMAMAGQQQTLYRAELEMALAARNATAVINAMKGQIGGLAPSFVNLRGLLTLVCQYLRMGRYWMPGNAQVLDKNLTDLLSRTDLAHIYRDAVPAAEKAWLASPANLAFMRTTILAQTVRSGATPVLNNPTETIVALPAPQCQITCDQLITNVFTAADDGITRHFGGFMQRPVEDIDPSNARPGDAINPSLRNPHRMAPVFELRNMTPKQLGPNVGDRFPRAAWVPLATYMATMIQLLNQRTQAQAVQDQKVLEHVGPGGPTGLGPAQAPW
jgi:hypothetical protein